MWETGDSSEAESLLLLVRFAGGARHARIGDYITDTYIHVVKAIQTFVRPCSVLHDRVEGGSEWEHEMGLYIQHKMMKVDHESTVSLQSTCCVFGCA